MNSTDSSALATEWTDPRDEIEIGVLMANGRLAPRRFSSHAEAQAWAHEDEGERVVEMNAVCSCDS
ncbi:hypothetical protein ACNI3K_06220 [Demequina sp. SO4-13]|uniref:hypothetical protein n=1 Tax=Demequina sp. SO4-13 TaxID=3401027 RepID=UPI003AF9AF65